MTIIIDFKSLFYEPSGQRIRAFLTDLLGKVVLDHPEQHWVFLPEGFTPLSGKQEKGYRKPTKKNLLPGKLGWKIWYDYRVPALIRKHSAHLYISAGGVTATSEIPQVVFLLFHLDPPLTRRKGFLSFFMGRLGKTARNTNTVFLFSDLQKKDMQQRYELMPAKLKLLYAAADEDCHPLLWTERENMKIKYAGGRDYFAVAATADEPELITLLKAFSLFKKRLQSNMQLVLIVTGTPADTHFAEKLETYKYRAEVCICYSPNPKETVSIIGASYALAYLAEPIDPGKIILNAFKSQVPVIITGVGCPAEVTGDAVLQPTTGDPVSWADQLMLLYKDESVRNACIEKGTQQLQQFSMERAAGGVWEGILNALNNNPT